MRFLVIAALLGLSSYVSSQKIDLDFIKAARPDPPTTEIAADKSNQTVEFDQAKAIANVVADIRENPLADSKKGSVQAPDGVQKRDEDEPIIIVELVDLEPACTILNGTLYGDDPTDSEDERVQKFLSNATLHEEALDVITPQNYTLVFRNLTNSTIQANGYLGYYVLSSYNASECAQRCSDTTGCQAFNIYFERDPSLVPGPNCRNPPALINTKCALWGGPISAGNALNAGQYRQLFHVVMSASNGYVLSSNLGPLSTFAIDAPLDCDAADTYMGFRLLNANLPFSEDLCAAACEETSRYAIAHPPSDPTKPPQLCTFYNTYILSKNSISQGQICAMYSQSWDPSVYATNDGQYDGEGNHFTIASSVFSGNVTLPICPIDISDLRLDAEASEFCTSYISYPGPSTVTTTITSASAAFAACSTSTTTETTIAGSGPIPRFARRDQSKGEVLAAEVAVYPEKVDNPVVTGSEPAVVTITGQDVYSSGAFSSAASKATAQLEAAATSASASTTGSLLDEKTPQVTLEPEATINKRQGRLPASTPTILEGRDYRVISSACSRIVDSATKTQTQTETPVAILEPEFDCSNVTSTCNDEVTLGIISGDNTDDTTFDLNLPFEICIYDTCDTRVRPSSNGLITLGGFDTTEYNNTVGIPATHVISNTTAALFAFWDDLVVDPSLGSYMRYAICYDTPAPSVRFEWVVRRFGTRGRTWSFSATFFSGQNNTVLLEYNKIPDGGISASVGAQGVRNGTAVSYTFAQNQNFAVAPFSTIINFDKLPGLSDEL